MNRFNELKSILEKKKISLSDSDILAYSQLFEALSELLHNKLTTCELLETYDFLSDLIEGKKPQIALSVPKSERIRAQYRAMEIIPQTAGKLTNEEKEVLAFCIWWSICIQVFDEKSQQVVSGLIELTTSEKIKEIFQHEKKARPGFFSWGGTDAIIADENYGFDVDHPIQLTSIPQSYAYLNSLFYGNSKIRYSRIGSFRNKNNDIIDGYTIEAYDPKNDSQIRTWTIYIYPYATRPIIKPPMGFMIKLD